MLHLRHDFSCRSVFNIPTHRYCRKIILNSLPKSVSKQTDFVLSGPLLKLILIPVKGKGKGLPQQAEVVQGVPGRLRPRIFLTFGTTRMAGRQPYAPAAFTPGEVPGSNF